MISRRFIPILAAALLLGFATPGARASGTITVFAAASLKTALDEVAAAWTEETGKTARISYAATSALAKQIAQGAPADVFISADLDWMDELARQQLVDTGSIKRVLGNELVLIAPKDSTAAVTLAAGSDLAPALGDGRLAITDVKAVPAGKYGKAALQTLGLWNGVESRLAQAENVRAALKLVAMGEAPLGIVYRSDARAEPAVKVLATFPTKSHPPIIYPAARVASSANDGASAFLGFLTSAKARAIFEAQGFTLPEQK